jgi:hypothetical protein
VKGEDFISGCGWRTQLGGSLVGESHAVASLPADYISGISAKLRQKIVSSFDQKYRIAWRPCNYLRATAATKLVRVSDEKSKSKAQIRAFKIYKR